MTERDKIKDAVFNAIDAFNPSQEQAHRLDKNENEVLFSRAGFTKPGKLDSLAMVYFLVTTEEHLQKQFGESYSLKIQSLIDDREKELKDIASLVKYIEKTL